MATPAPIVKVYYGKPMLPDVSRVLACLHEKDVNFELIDMYKGQQINPDLIKFQASRAPVSGFEDGDTRLFESRTICRHIVDKYADRGNKYLLGRDLLERASIEQWLKSEEHSFDPPSWALVFHLAFKVEPDRELINESERRLSKVLDVYEQRLGESNFLAGDEFSLADLSHLPNSHYLARSREWSYLFESRKNVSKWWEEISSRHSWQQVVKILNELGLLKELNGTSNRGYQFLSHKKLDLQSPASDALSNQTQEQTIQPSAQQNFIDQQTTTNAQSSTQPAATGSPSSQIQGQKVQLAQQADSTGQSIPQQTTSIAQQSVTKEANPDTQSSVELPSSSTSSQKQGQKEQPTHQADSAIQSSAEQTTTRPATTSALPSQTNGGQKVRQADSSGESSAMKTAPDTQSSAQLIGSQMSKEQEKNTQQMRQAYIARQPAIREGTIDALPSSLSNTKQEQIFQTNGQTDSSSQLLEQKAPLHESTTQQATASAFSSQKHENGAQATYPANTGRSVAQQAPTIDKFTQQQPAPGALSSQEQKQTTQQTQQEKNSGQTDAQEGQTDVQYSSQQGPPSSISGKKHKQNTNSMSTGDSAGKSIPQGQAMIDAQPYTESPASGVPSDQKREENAEQTLQANSPRKTAAKQGVIDEQSSTQQGLFEQEQQKESIVQADLAGLPITQQPTTAPKSSTEPLTSGAQSGQKQEQYDQKSFNKATNKQGSSDVQPDTMPMKMPEQDPQLTSQEDAKGQSISKQASLDVQSSTQSTEPTTPDDQFSQNQQLGTMQTSQSTSSADTIANQGPTDAELSTRHGPPTEVLSEKEEENAKVAQADSPRQSADQQATEEGKSSNAPTSTESTSADTVANQGPTAGKGQLISKQATIDVQSSPQSTEPPIPDDQFSQNQQLGTMQTSQGTSSVDTIVNQRPTDAELSTQHGPPTEVLSEKKEENAKVAQADSPGQSADQQATGEDKSSNAPTSTESTSADTVANQGPTAGKLSTQQGPPGDILSEKQEKNAAVAQADSAGLSGHQQDTGEGKFSNAPTSAEATSENDTTGGTNNQSGFSTESTD